ncbi:MAG: GAF domain-containing protein [Candidatus Neomarinimicrobiota bacterium]|nr:MAG: GAF domain-containing protein [Candidatus Neomarinimicrobiota bacterium]
MPFIELERIKEIASGQIKRNEKLKSICTLLKDCILHYDWVGFYIVDDFKKELYLGPYSGNPTEHTQIPFGKGVCGQVAEKGNIAIIQDVSKQKNYLSCSLNVKSEIVVPILKNGEFVAELDIDSHSDSPFTEWDEKVLKKICVIVSKLF